MNASVNLLSDENLKKGAASVFPDAKSWFSESSLGRQLAAEKEGLAGPIAMSPPKFSSRNPPSDEFRDLLIQYCATCLGATTLADVSWGNLATALGTKADWLKDAATQMNSEDALWRDIMMERIRRAGAAKLFRDIGWERLESKAVGRLIQLVESSAIRDIGELLAVAAAAHRANGSPSPASQGGNQGGGNQMNVYLGATPTGELPGAGAKMTLDLSPRAAERLAQTAAKPDGSRVIDSEMLSVSELRNLLEDKVLEPPVDQPNEQKE